MPPSRAQPTVIPANGTGTDDLRILLDTLCSHPNVGPFLSRQLIQRLVTSNPSPGYVYRVAQVFANNGRGTRGDLGAVVRAVLTDYEARSVDAAAMAGFGKIKEPVLRATSLMRVMRTASPSGRFLDAYFPKDNSYPRNPQGSFFTSFENVLSQYGQAPLHSPSVFNFFSPYYTAPGPLADSGLVAPELQIVDSSLAVTAPNELVRLIYRGEIADVDAPSPYPFLRNDFSALLALSDNVTGLVDRLDRLLCGGSLGAVSRAKVLAELTRIPVAQPIQNFAGSRQQALRTAGGRGMVAPKTAAFDPGAAFTMEAWLFPTETSTSGYYFIAGKRPLSASPFALFQLMWVPGGKVSVDLSNGTT
ncbi:MAG: DUF1800 family protein, partial [Proteobacteria bacterium]|nr:DUF1800 family protein [Pseudomonadota bacterium]